MKKRLGLMAVAGKAALAQATLIAVLALGLVLVGCATDPSFTVKVANDMQKLNVTDRFRFYVSKDVTLKRKTTETGVANKVTVVKQKVLNDVIYLRKNTTGRARNYEQGKYIEIVFDRVLDANGDEKRITFILKNPDYPALSDKFYFKYVEDSERTEVTSTGSSGNVIKRTEVSGKLIAYGKDENRETILYEVSYKGEEPYLLYKEDVKEKTKKRKMKGLN